MPRKRKPNLPAQSQDVDKVGRPSKLTPELVKTLTNALIMGSYVDVAAIMAGITPRTMEYWMQLGRAEPHGEHAKFLEDVKVALAKSEIRDLAVIDMYAQGRSAEYVMTPVFRETGEPLVDLEGKQVWRPALDGNGQPIIKRREILPQWQAAAWKLERRAQKRWGRTDRLLIDDVTRVIESPDAKQPDEVTGERIDRVKDLLKGLTEIEDMEEL